MEEHFPTKYHNGGTCGPGKANLPLIVSILKTWLDNSEMVLVAVEVWKMSAPVFKKPVNFCALVVMKCKH